MSATASIELTRAPLAAHIAAALGGIAAAGLLPVTGLHAQENAGPSIEEVVVFGRATRLVGAAGAASEGRVGGADLAVRPLLRVAEVLEAVPGLIAAQHSGTGKANQYFLRGFNLDHGTDFSTYIDGVPWNLRSHGHGQGYLDVNGLMPEIIDSIEYRKGPYRASVGDFSMAGSSHIETIDGWDRPFVSLETGEFGWRRIATGGTTDVASGRLTGAAQWKTYDGPWQLEEDLDLSSVWGKYARETGFGRLDLTLHGYRATWRPTEQIPERAIGTPVCADEFCSLDPTATGETTRWIAGAELEGERWNATGYLQYYDWSMLSNPTYDYQIRQADRRWTLGGRIERNLVQRAALDVDVGGELRYDDIGRVRLDHTENALFVENISDNAIRETSLGVYAEATWVPTERLRVLAGLRGDVYDFDVTARSPGSASGSERDSQVSPKLGAAWAATDNVELYANWGRGFHSNDARGVVNRDEPVPGLVEGTGYEAGARFEVGDLTLTAAYWWLDLDSELVFVGDANSVEPSEASERRGYEIAAFWRPIEWLGIDAVYTGSRARYASEVDGGFRIDGAIEHAGQLGVSAVTGPWEASVRLRYLGPYALLPDNSVRAESETHVNLRAAYTAGRMTFYGELLNAFDEKGKDIVYWYEAYVEGLDAVEDGPGLPSERIDCSVVNCRMSRAEEPRTVRVGVTYRF
ncbi:MAG: TonB-dependent receptor [Gammaproteobacteria bacterium]|nr:TonB-dependent receptor [Gammaproteobacteria bacterium]